MNLSELSGSGILGLLFVLTFFILLLILGAVNRSQAGKTRRRPLFREITAFNRLGRAVGRAVEAGQQIHVSLGWGGVSGIPGMSGLLGISVLQRIARAASVSDQPPVASSGEGTLGILSQDSLRSAHDTSSAETLFNPSLGQVSGLTPFSYAVGVLPVIYDQQVSTNFLAGHFGSEVGLIADAGERKGSLTLAGSDHIPAQAVLYATAQEPLIGEELYASSAYLQTGAMHTASLSVQDIFRWVIILSILAGAALKLVGVL